MNYSVELYPHKQFKSTMGLLIHVNDHKSWSSSTYIFGKEENSCMYKQIKLHSTGLKKNKKEMFKYPQ